MATGPGAAPAEPFFAACKAEAYPSLALIFRTGVASHNLFTAAVAGVSGSYRGPFLAGGWQVMGTGTSGPLVSFPCDETQGEELWPAWAQRLPLCAPWHGICHGDIVLGWGGSPLTLHLLLTLVFLRVMWSLLRNGPVACPGDDNPRALTAEISHLLWNENLPSYWGPSMSLWALFCSAGSETSWGLPPWDELGAAGMWHLPSMYEFLSLCCRSPSSPQLMRDAHPEQMRLQYTFSPFVFSFSKK